MLKNCSIGFRCGEYGGRYIILHPNNPTISINGSYRCIVALSHMIIDLGPGYSFVYPLKDLINQSNKRLLVQDPGGIIAKNK